MRLLLAAITFLIAYGSLFPFAVDFRSYHPTMLASLFDFGIGNTGRGDLVANVLLFVPFGLVAVNVVPVRATGPRVFLVLLVSAIFAFALQAAQLVIPGRVPAGSDAVWNLLGCTIGCVLGVLFSSPLQRRINGLKELPAVPVILAVLWLLFGLAPFVPSIDLQLLKDNLKALLAGSPSPLWILQSMTMWLIVFHFLRASTSRIFAGKHYPAIVALTLVSSFFIVGHAITTEKLIGGMLALLVWFIFKTRIRPIGLAMLLIVVIVGINFTPFELRRYPIEFNWIPFAGALKGNLFVNVLAMFKKLVLYGSLIWLLTESRFSLRLATGVTAILLFVCEYLQILYVNTTPEITDPLLALGIGFAIFRYQDRLNHGGATTTAPAPDPSRIRMRSEPRVGHVSQYLRSEVSAHSLPGLDGLRAIAALAVFFVHFNQQVELKAKFGAFELERFLANGNTGVALFFVLSGLLLSLPFWQAQLGQAPLPDLRGYAWRRAGRIIPAYYLCLFVILFAKSIGGSGTSWNDIISHLLFVHNLSDWNILSLNQPFWTLAVEAQFYVFLLLLFLALRKSTARAATIAILLMVPAAYFLNYAIVDSVVTSANFPVYQKLIWPFALYLSGPNSFVLTYSTLGHLPHFLIGVIAARVFLHLLGPEAGGATAPKLFDAVIAVVVMAIAIILGTPIDDVLQVPYGRYNFPYVPLLLAVLVVSVPFSSVFRRVLSWRVVAWLGAISYGIYLFHYPVQKVIAKVMVLAGFPANKHAFMFAAFSLGATLVCSQLSYALLEAPAMRWVRKRRAEHKSANEYGGTENHQSQRLTRGVDEILSATTDDRILATVYNSESGPAQASGVLDHTLELNLHQYQFDYLEELGRSSGLDTSALCGAMIANSTRADGPPANASPAIDPGQHDARVDRRKVDWTSASVTLGEDAWGVLTELARRSNRSRSRILRELLEARIAQTPRPRLPSDGTRSVGRSHPNLSRRWRSLAVVVVIALLGVGIWFYASRVAGPIFVTNPAWAGSSASLVFDHHAHTRFSDGALSPSDLVKLGVDGGCNVMAITDHSDKGGSANPTQLAEIGHLRRQYPDLLLFAGIELNMPSYRGREHVSVIVEPAYEATVLREMGNVAELSIKKAWRNDAGPPSDVATLELIRDFRQENIGMLITYNHPSRKATRVEEILENLLRWDESNELFTGIAGAPGHQNAADIGSYQSALLTEDRWDPAVASIGGVWDQLLGRGYVIWGAFASSDFHNSQLDKAPCAFSRIHIATDDRSYSGVLKALKSGTFWADHGNILNELHFGLELPGLERPAYPGAVIRVASKEETAVVTFSIERGQGSMGFPLKAEVISNCRTGTPELVHSSVIAPGQSYGVGLVPIQRAGADAKSCYVRARVRMQVAGQSDLMAYTNPIRILF